MIASVGLLAAACGSEPETVAPADTTIASDAPAYTVKTVDVDLVEGTNLAMDVHPETADRVVSLQGSLFLLPESRDAAVPLTDAYYDAREPQFSPDGSSVVFFGYRHGHWDLFQVEVASRAISRLTEDAFDDREPQYSADGTQVVFSSDRSGSYDIWLLDLTAKTLTQVTHSQDDAHSPAISASGAIAYTQASAGRSQLIVRRDGEDTVLSEQLGQMSGIEWSPDESFISYQILGAEGAQVRIVETDTAQDLALSPPGFDVFPFRGSWMGADMLAYTANGKVYRHRVTVEQPVEWPFKVTVTLNRHEYAHRQRDYDSEKERPALGISTPVIGNDGADIYFAAVGDVWHWRPQDDALTNLTDDPYAEHSLTLSPDGTQLAYVADGSGANRLTIRDLAAGEARTLDVGSNQISVPSWSPDGQQLGYFVAVPGNPLGGQLMVMDLDSGTTQKVLTPMPAQPITWSKDGSRVAVTRLNPYANRFREGIYELLVTPVDGGETVTIAPSEHRSIIYAGLTADDAMTYVQGGYLHRLELDDKYQPVESAGRLTDELTDMPSFSANGEYVLYLSGAKLKRMEVTSGNVVDVTPDVTWRIDAPDEQYVVRAGRVWTGVDAGYLLDHDIFVDGNRILKIQPAGDAGDWTVIDAADKSVVPGFFEMHAHMGETSEVQGRVWLSYGITTVRDPGSNPYIAKERQEAWDSGRRVGPRTHITGYLTDGNRVYYSMAEGIIGEEHLGLALERTRDLELDFIKTYVRLPDHWQREVVEFAHGIGIPVSSHELYPAVAHGMDHVEHIGGTSRRGYQPKVSRVGYSYQDVIDLLSTSGMGITATAVLPGFAVIVADEPDWFDTPQFERFYGADMRRSYEMMAPRFGAGAAGYAKANGKLLRELTQNDALLVTGTDSPFVPYGAGLHAEFRLYDRAGVSPEDILRQATLKSAQAAGVANELGSLEAGKLADLVVVDGDPLNDIRDLDKVVMTVKNGRRYTLDELLNP